MDNQRWEKSRGKRKVLGIILSILIFLGEGRVLSDGRVS